jgi:hypothetical protein
MGVATTPNEIADKLRESWQDGNRNYVIQLIKGIKGNIKCSLVVLYLCDSLPAYDQGILSRMLQAELY